MIEQYGKAFRSIRKNKGISVRRLAYYSKFESNEGISSAGISKFERESSNLSLPKILNLLNIMNVPVSEFALFAEEFQNTVEEDFNNIWKYFSQQDIESLRYLEKVYLNNIDKLPRNNHLAILCNELINRIEGIAPNRENLGEIEIYLLNTDTWYYYELVLFTNALFLFEPNRVDSLAKRAITKIEDYKHLKKEKNERIYMLFNIVIFFMENDYIFLSEKYLEIAKKELKATRFLYEKVKCLYLEGCLEIKKANINSGCSICEEAISLMERLDIKTEAEQHKQYLQDMLKSV